MVEEARQALEKIAEPEAAAPALAGGWSRKQLLGHLIDSASNNHQRFVRALIQDELRWPNYDQEACVRVERFQEAPWADLVSLWAHYNRFLAHVIDGIPESKKSTPCHIGDNPAMTLQQLAEDYLVHMRHHLEQF